MDCSREAALFNDDDPAAEFLAREQFMLGDLEAEVNAISAAGSSSTDGSELLTGNINEVAVVHSVGFDSTNGSFELISGGADNNEISNIVIEPKKIRKWREEQKKNLEEKDRDEERKKAELWKQAKMELDDWLRQTEEFIAKAKVASRNAEKQAAVLENCSAMEPGTEWERIAKLCDFNPKVNKTGKDVSRMRSIYLHLKQNPIPI